MAASMRTSPFVFKTSSIDHLTENNNELINHYFNNALTLILPGVNAPPNSITDCFTEQIAYKLYKLPLYRLIEMAFIHAFVKNGSCYMMSLNTHLDTDNCAAVTPTGWLILHMTKDTYQELGLEAVKQTHAQKKSDTYVVKINLLAEHFRPGKKGYDKTMWCFKDRLDLVFDFLVTWEPHDDKVSSSSVGVYFSEKCERIERQDVKKKFRIFTSIPYPKVDPDLPEGSEAGCHYRDFFDWMGALACDIDLTADNIGPDSYTSTFTCPEPAGNCPRCCVFQASGFITPQTVIRVWTALRKFTSTHNKFLPASLTVSGFADSPVNHKTVSHNFYISGDNLYTLVLLPDDKFWSYTASVS